MRLVIQDVESRRPAPRRRSRNHDRVGHGGPRGGIADGKYGWVIVASFPGRLTAQRRGATPPPTRCRLGSLPLPAPSDLLWHRRFLFQGGFHALCEALNGHTERLGQPQQGRQAGKAPSPLPAPPPHRAQAPPRPYRCPPLPTPPPLSP